MRSYALSLLTLLAASSVLSGCTREGDYQVAVSWLINGTTPHSDLCAEQRIAKARFEVSSAGGKRVKTIEANCADTIRLSDSNTYGGFLSTGAFDWDTQYFFTLTLVDAAGAPISLPQMFDFTVRDDTDIYELGYLDFVQPNGTFAALSGEWSLRAGELATQAACDAAGVDKVRIYAASALDADLLDAVQVAEVPCGQARFASAGKVLARGNYVFWYEAYSAAGAFVADTQTTAPILVDGSNDVVLPRRSFF